MTAFASVAVPASAATPTVTVSPDTNVSDQQKVRVQFTGFAPEVTLLVRQCVPAPKNGDDCDFLSLLSVVSDSRGAGELEYLVRALPSPELPGPVPCDPQNPCAVVVSTDLNDFAQPTAEARLQLGTAPADPVAATENGRTAGEDVRTGGDRRTLLGAGLLVGVGAAAVWLGRRRRSRVQGQPGWPLSSR
ncbi:MAG: neocarzinostatin apoprotein domain-containing protein [Pseudonocardiaceae bacterium]